MQPIPRKRMTKARAPIDFQRATARRASPASGMQTADPLSVRVPASPHVCDGYSPRKNAPRNRLRIRKRKGNSSPSEYRPELLSYLAIVGDEASYLAMQTNDEKFLLPAERALEIALRVDDVFSRLQSLCVIKSSRVEKKLDSTRLPVAHARARDNRQRQ